MRAPAPHKAELSRPLVERAVRAALEEDLGLAGDITSQATLPADATARAVFSARAPGIVCGLDVAAMAFALIGPGLEFRASVADGDAVAPGDAIAAVAGTARLILGAERAALNFLCHLSGIATATREFVEAVAGTGARITCTRKTTPGLRAFEKYAVRVGGGVNHRFGLDDAILIKDNHIAVAGGVAASIEAARAFAGHLTAIEVEVTTLDELDEALQAGATAILLDNMSPDEFRAAVGRARGTARLEASGGVTLETVRAIAGTGVDFISTSAITMAAAPLDIGLDVEIEG